MISDVSAAQIAEEKKNITVRIFGADYPIAKAMAPDHLEELAAYVDGKMADIAKNSPLLSSGKVAILAALNIANELFKLRDGHRRLKDLATERIVDIIKVVDSETKK